MLSQSNLCIFGCLVSRFCQPIESLFVFSSAQFLIQILCCSCTFNCYGFLCFCFSLCLFVSSMNFLCFRLLPLLEHPLFPGYCLLDCCMPPHHHDDHNAVQEACFAVVACIPASHSTTTTDKFRYPLCNCCIYSCDRRQHQGSGHTSRVIQ